MIGNNDFQRKEWEYLKSGMEDELTHILKWLIKDGFKDLDRFFEDDYLDQGYSLTMPFEDVSNLIYFQKTCEEILDEVTSAGKTCNRLNDLLSFVKQKLAYEIQNVIEFKKEITLRDAELILEYAKEEDLILYNEDAVIPNEKLLDNLCILPEKEPEDPDYDPDLE